MAKTQPQKNDAAREEKKPVQKVGAAKAGIPLAQLPVGASAVVLHVAPQLRGRKKFSDIGLVPGAELTVESKAPFGGLIRIRVMETSMAVCAADVAGITVEP